MVHCCGMMAKEAMDKKSDTTEAPEEGFNERQVKARARRDTARQKRALEEEVTSKAPAVHNMRNDEETSVCRRTPDGKNDDGLVCQTDTGRHAISITAENFIPNMKKALLPPRTPVLGPNNLGRTRALGAKPPPPRKE